MSGTTLAPAPDEEIAVSPPDGSRRRWRRRATETRQPPPPPPPRRPPAPPRRPTPGQLLAQSGLALAATMFLGLVAYVTGFSHLQHTVNQMQLRPVFAEQLAEGTAPVSEGTFDDVLLRDGVPVAILDIPALGVHEIVVEGTSSAQLASGPGHRRDTVLPGQVGVSVIFGRAAAFGGPFGGLQRLAPGETFTVITGQGEHVYQVIGIRYAGDPSPAVASGGGRLVLTTARGPAYLPQGVLRLDAELISEVQAPGQRDTLFRTLPAEHRELASDTTTAWALVFALQFLVLAEVGAVWSWHRMGARRTWLVFGPILLLTAVITADQLVRLLPNLL